MNNKTKEQECNGDEVDFRNQSEESEDLIEYASSFHDRIQKELTEYTYAYLWARDEDNVQEGMRDFIREFIPVHKQIEFAGTDIGIVNGCMVELNALGTPGAAHIGEDEPRFKAIKKCSRLYHDGKPVPTKLFIVNLGCEWVCQYDLAYFADAIKDEYDEQEHFGHLGASWEGQECQYFYAEPEDKRKLWNILNRRSNQQCLSL